MEFAFSGDYSDFHLLFWDLDQSVGINASPFF
jgi:hypothetical protein